MRVGRVALMFVNCVKVIAAGILAIASALCSAAGLGGTLSGDVTQEHTSARYSVEMEIYGSVGSVDYPSLHCGGKVRLLREEHGVFVYRERITYGKEHCHKSGTIQIAPAAPGETTAWSWAWEGGGMSAEGLIYGPAVKNES